MSSFFSGGGSTPVATVLNVFRPEDYGAVGDGATDDTTALTNCIAAWLAGYATISGEAHLGTILFTRQYYVGGSTITVKPGSGISVNGGAWEFIGNAVIIGSSNQYAFAFSNYEGDMSNPSQQWRGLTIRNYHGWGCGLKFTNTDNGTGMYQITLDNPRIKANGTPASDHGLYLNGVYESQIRDGAIEWNSTSKSCIYVDNYSIAEPAATWSSLTFNNVNTRFGLHGLQVEGYNSDLVIIAGTFLQALDTGISLKCYNAMIYGPHVENNCSSSGDAGIYFDGGAHIFGLMHASVSSISDQKYGVRAHCDWYSTISGGNAGSDISGAKLAIIETSGGTADFVTLQGFAAYSYDVDTSSWDSRQKINVPPRNALAVANNANTTVVVPAGYRIEALSFWNTTANTVTGGVKVGTTSGGSDVVSGLTVSGNAIGDATPSKRVFSASSDTTLYIQPVTSWNSANVRFTFQLTRVF